MRDGRHLTAKGAAVFGCEFVRVVDEDIRICADEELTVKTQRNTNKHLKKCSPIISESELKCVCINARGIINKSELDIMVADSDPQIICIT